MKIGNLIDDHFDQGNRECNFTGYCPECGWMDNHLGKFFQKNMMDFPTEDQFKKMMVYVKLKLTLSHRTNSLVCEGKIDIN